MKIQNTSAFLLTLALFSCGSGKPDDANQSLDAKLQVQQSAQKDISLEKHFANPTDATKPLTWFHAMSGNMSKAGITKDLEALDEVGVGGTILFNVTQGIPIGDIKFNSDRHVDIITHMAAESERLGLSFGIHNSDGWTSSGGPWVTPEHSMKKVVWTEHITEGGAISVPLQQADALFDYYEDIAIIAYPSLEADIQNAEMIATISASNDSFEPDIVSDQRSQAHTEISYQANFASSVVLDSNIDSQPSFETNEMPWIQFAYANAQTVRSIDALFFSGRGLKFALYTSNDGKKFSFHEEFDTRRPGKNLWAADAVIQPATAKYFRLYANQTFYVQEMSLSANHLIDNYLGRSSVARTDYVNFKNIGEPSEKDIILSSSVIDLSANMTPDGQLDAQLPPGKWTIMRFGYTSTGAVNIPASKEGTGLEVDKFSREAFAIHYQAYLKRVLDRAKVVAPNATQFVEIDSYEVGGQNWTHGYESLFEKRFAYSLMPYLPLFAGKFVDNAHISEGVLWDTRQLNGELIVDNYYRYFTELANKDGVKTYIEPYGFGPFNDLDAGGAADIPMGEFWLKRDNMKIAAAASASRIYGKNITSAEAFTAQQNHNWRFYPAMAKIDGDRGYALGVNEMVFHRFAHQANTHVMPGMTMNRWGSHFDRTQPWWNTAGKAWFTYMARTQYLLRQGVAQSDVLWYLGDASPTACPDKFKAMQVLPASINYDCLNSEVLNKQLSASDSRLVLPNGASYKWLYLTNVDSISLESTRSLYDLAKQGVVIVGKRPSQLANWRASETDIASFTQMLDYIWSQKTTYSSLDLPSLYEENGFFLDMNVKGIEDVFYTHRKSADADFYFLYNPKDSAAVFEASFDVANKIPELWDPITGEIRKTGVFALDNDGQTSVQFLLEKHQSMFVVFREYAGDVNRISPSEHSKASLEKGLILSLDESHQLNATAERLGDYQLSAQQQISFNQLPEPQQLNGPWQVTFDGFYGLDKTFTFKQLVDWAVHPEQEIQDYSGTARYQSKFTIEENNSSETWLDLGTVAVSASVYVNDKHVAVSWMPPHQLDITEYLKTGENVLRVEVANLWVNRLIADEALPDTSGFEVATTSNNVTTLMVDWYKNNEAPPPTERITFTTQPFFKASDEKASSGLIGPVRLMFKKTKRVD
ncbi:glycosyl hydrolase [Glaciecola sp. SC05]|uniref:glycosyl hydrolase n=1 Tax=Glaciecola sp. SC05 TaxID=1987355 RepID=UPI003528EDD2